MRGSFKPIQSRAAATIVGILLAACGGGGVDSGGSSTSTTDDRAQALGAGSGGTGDGVALAAATTQFDAVRLANQAAFGATEALVAEITSKGPATWIQQQMALNESRYTAGGTSDVHKNQVGVSYCSVGAQANNPNCWRDYYSTDPLVWDFYRNAVNKPDQLRQRVALALQHILVISGEQISGTYGFRNYYNTLLGGAFGNYRDVLKKAVLSPLMGDYLTYVNNDKTAPNENIGRELLQLFSIGTCRLNLNGSLVGGACTPTYNNDVVRNYAYSLTGWTYPIGGSASWRCSPEGSNCRFYGGDMASASALRDGSARKLLSGITVPAGSSAPQALELVLDSVMQHANIAPFISKRLIQHLVSSNPSPAFVARVAQAFQSGQFESVSGGVTKRFGTGVRGDLAATVAAVLLDTEARGEGVARRGAGFLRQPALMFAGVIRGLNGRTDGGTLGYWWGEQLRQHIFQPPSVFNFYPPTYPVAGTQLVGPEFGIHNANTALGRLNYLTYLLDWGGSPADPTIPKSAGTGVNLKAFESSAPDAAALVDRISLMALGKVMAPAARQPVINAVVFWTAQNAPTDWKTRRVGAAAYLVYGSPDYQVQR